MKRLKEGLAEFNCFILFVLVLIFILILVVVLWPDDKNNSSSIVVKDREEAREIMEEFLLEKYGESYEVSLPARTDSGDFHAYFYDPLEKVVEVDVETGECRDSKTADIVLDYLEENIESKINDNWLDNMSEFAVNFVSSVPSKNWPVDSDPLDIIAEENMYFTLIILVNTDSIDKLSEVEKVKAILNLEEFANFDMTLDIYYVNNESYQKIIQTYQNSTNNDKRLYLSIDDSSYYNRLTVRYNYDHEITSEEILEDFVN